MIKKILYTRVPKNICDQIKAAESYWNHSIIDSANSEMISEFEKFESSQMRMKNLVIANEIIDSGMKDLHPNMNSSVIAISSTTDNVVVTCEI